MPQIVSATYHECQALLPETRQGLLGNMHFMEDIGMKIQNARKQKGWSQGRLAEEMGVTRNAVSLWETGANGISTSHARKLRSILSIDLDNFALDMSDYETRKPPGILVKGEVGAGLWLEIDGPGFDRESIPVAPDPRYAQFPQFALKVRGPSMNKLVPSGQFVVIADWAESGQNIKDGDVIVVRRESGHKYEVTLKRAKWKNGKWELWPESTDPRYQEPITLNNGEPDASVTIIGRVIGRYEPF